MMLKKAIILMFIGAGLSTFAQENKNNNNDVVKLRPKFNTQLNFSQQETQSTQKINFTKSITKEMEAYSDSLKSIYLTRAIYIQGYSVLAYNGSDKAEGLKLRSQILKYFPEVTVTLDYISPNFKLRAGPFEQKMEAVRIQEGLLKHGFSSVMIAPDNILVVK